MEIDQDFIDRIRKEQETILQDYSKIIKKVENGLRHLFYITK